MVDGVEKLNETDQTLFNLFCTNYRAANDSETEIQFLSVQREENYLRVDMLKNGRRTWQQVFSSTTWG